MYCTYFEIQSVLEVTLVSGYMAVSYQQYFIIEGLFWINIF